MTIRFDWNQAHTFLAVAEAGSMTAAASTLKLAQPTVGRHIAALERSLGMALVERAGAGIRLTPEGIALRERLLAMAAVAADIGSMVEDHVEELRGTVRISASEMNATYLLVDVLRGLRSHYPELDIELVVSDDQTNILEREADIALRSFVAKQPDLIMTRIGDDRAYAYATPEYLAAIGNPSTPGQLCRDHFPVFSNLAAFVEALKSFGVRTDEGMFPFSCNSHLMLWAYARHGLGIGFASQWIGDAEPGLVRVMPDRLRADFPLWLVAHRGVKGSRRIRAVFDYLKEHVRLPSPAAGR